MPLYEYECAASGHRFERIQKFSDAPVEECPSCGERKVQTHHEDHNRPLLVVWLCLFHHELWELGW